MKDEISREIVGLNRRFLYLCTRLGRKSNLEAMVTMNLPIGFVDTVYDLDFDALERIVKTPIAMVSPALDKAELRTASSIIDSQTRLMYLQSKVRR